MLCYSGQKFSIQGVENIRLYQFLVILHGILSGFNRDLTYRSFKCEDRSNIRLFLYPATHLSRKINISQIADEEWYIENGTFYLIEYETYYEFLISYDISTISPWADRKSFGHVLKYEMNSILVCNTICIYL